MENIFVSLVCISMLIMGTVAVAATSFQSLDTLAYAWKDGESSVREIRNTTINSVSSNTTADGAQVVLTIKNDGHTAMANFSKWDVIIVYQAGSVQWIPYTTATPGWTVGGIYLNGGTEIYEPNIFNPMETMKIVVKLSPPAAAGATNLATITTPNGVSTQLTFSR
jgi:archaellum component FlaF (FlaF/FlaG flagellin family)